MLGRYGCNQKLKQAKNLQHKVMMTTRKAVQKCKTWEKTYETWLRQEKMVIYDNFKHGNFRNNKTFTVVT